MFWSLGLDAPVKTFMYKTSVLVVPNPIQIYKFIPHLIIYSEKNWVAYFPLNI